MTIDEIRELISLANESGVAELEVQRGDSRVRIRRATLPNPQEIVLASHGYQGGGTAPASIPAVAAQPAGGETQTQSAPALPPAPDPKLVLVKSPIVGTFYDAPSPGSSPFVGVGTRVAMGQVLCIIESMKLMNEIESDVAGVVESKLVINGHPVEYGEALFAIRAV